MEWHSSALGYIEHLWVWIVVAVISFVSCFTAALAAVTHDYLDVSSIEPEEEAPKVEVEVPEELLGICQEPQTEEEFAARMEYLDELMYDDDGYAVHLTPLQEEVLSRISRASWDASWIFNHEGRLNLLSLINCVECEFRELKTEKYKKREQAIKEKKRLLDAVKQRQRRRTLFRKARSAF